MRHGEGRAEYKNGDVYDGVTLFSFLSFFGFIFNGDHILTPSLLSLSQLWANDIPHGKGTLKTSMATFDGEFNVFFFFYFVLLFLFFLLFYFNFNF